MMKTFSKRILVVFFLSFILFILTVPSYYLKISLEWGEEACCKSLPPGLPFILRFIHSVEQTPVEGEYMVAGGRIRQWEERVRSHNAGLPAEAPLNGRFIPGKDWMAVRGGGASFISIRYRVGDSILGRNMLIIDGEEIELFRLYPGRILLIRAEKMSFAGRLLSRLF